jgi:hypothetical protein
MIPMRHGMVPAVGSVDVGSIMSGRAMGTLTGIGFADFDNVLVHVVSMDMMQVSAAQIVRMTRVVYRRVPTASAMLMRMVLMLNAFSHMTLL